MLPLQFLASLVPTSRVFWKKTAERLVRTYVQAFAAVLLAGTTLFNVSVWDAANTAGIGAVGSLLMSLLGSRVGDPNSPSLLSQDAVCDGSGVSEDDAAAVDG